MQATQTTTTTSTQTTTTTTTTITTRYNFPVLKILIDVHPNAFTHIIKRNRYVTTSLPFYLNVQADVNKANSTNTLIVSVWSELSRN